jgi:pimeloyl-ACP methyl ester carboxylesterase
MATFVLVHGGWHGGWCWKRVTPLLRAAGHEVYTPTLTGFGERVHLARPEIGLETHIQDVLGVLEYEDLADVVLVGHSFGGMVITSVADRRPERIAHVVYLDAQIPQDGQSALDVLRDEWPDGPAWIEGLVQSGGDGWRVPVPDNVIDMLGIGAAKDAAWVLSKLTPTPFKSVQDPVHLTDRIASLPRTNITCIWDNPPGGLPPPSAAGMRYRELATGHDAMILAPRLLADLLFEVL